MKFSIYNVAVTTAKEILWVLLNHETSGTNVNLSVDIPVESAEGKPLISDLPAERRLPTSKTAENPEKSSSLHALVIGISNYKSPNVFNLRGAVADADAFSNYLITHLHVPPSQVTNLRDTEATREKIIDSIRDLGRNKSKKGDPILIFFAGHGASAPAPAGWETGNNMVQSIVPYDCRVNVGESEVRAIPDRTLGGLLQQLADDQGNNITVIFDCCYSGSGTRKDAIMKVLDPTRISRGFELLPDELPEDLDQTIWQNKEQGRGTAIPPGFQHAGLHSHVLLSACGANELALEEAGRGVFTSALLNVLYQVGTNTITYKDLMRRIPHLPGHNPQCEGANSGRCLFNGLVPSWAQTFYNVRRDGDKYILDAGEVHGITGGMEFAVYPSLDFITEGKPLGSLRSELDLVKPFQSELLRLSDTLPHFNIPAQSFATPTGAGECQALRLHVPMDSKLVPVFQAVAQQLATRSPGQRTIVLVDQDKAELSVALDVREQIEFKLVDSVMTGYGLNRLYRTLPPHVEVLRPLISAAAHFFWHLRRQPAKCQLRDKVDVLFHELVETDELDDNLRRILKPSKDNLNVGGVVDIESSDETWYGMTIQNKSQAELYVSVFYFDCSDLSISPYYMTPTGTSASKVDWPLGPKGSLTIGYGTSGSLPSRYSLKLGQTLDVGYIRLFISTDAIDLSNIRQLSPFDGKPRQLDLAFRLPQPMWDVITIAVIQWPKGAFKGKAARVLQ